MDVADVLDAAADQRVIVYDAGTAYAALAAKFLSVFSRGGIRIRPTWLIAVGQPVWRVEGS